MALDLPPDVLRKVLGRLTTRHRKAASLVCKDWKQVEADSRRHLKISDSDHLVQLVSRYSSITDLDVRSCGMDITDQLLADFLPHCRALEILNLSQKLFTEEYRELFEEVHPALIKEGLLTDTGLETLGLNCPRLRYLSLAYRSEIKGLGFETLARACTELRGLNLTYCKRIQDRALAAIATLPKLRKLVLVGCSDFTDRGLVSLGQGAAAGSLESLELRDCNQIGEEGFKAVANLPRLRVLDLEDCHPGVKDAVLMRIAEGCKELEKLSVANCQWLTDAGVNSIVRNCSGLSELVLSNLEWITDDAMAKIAVHLTGLKRLSVDGCPAKIALAFNMLARSCDLQQIRISKSLASGGGSVLIETLEEKGCHIKYVTG